MTHLQTVQQHNAAKLPNYRKDEEPVPTGVACPKCQTELLRPHSNVVLASIPPMFTAVCPKCGNHEYLVC